MRILNRISNLRLTAVICLLSVTFSSCSLLSGTFTPTTLEAARCKRDCTAKLHSCRLNNCDSMYLSCMDYCMDIDRIAGERSTKK
jgi:hypothetical protein